MLVANTVNGSRILTWRAEKREAPFYCPECQAVVTLKKGAIREHHFAHKPPVNCQYGTGESKLHERVKRSIYEALRQNPDCSKCELERRLAGVRPDVSLYIGNTPVAIEIQRSTIRVDEILRRTVQYTKLGVHLLWLIPFPTPDSDLPYRPPEWQKYLHTLYFGRLYFWVVGALVQPVHLSTHPIWVEEREWFDETGTEMSAGGYYRVSKSLRQIDRDGPVLDIARDFKAVSRSSFETKYHILPAARLWLDNKDQHQSKETIASGSV